MWRTKMEQKVRNLITGKEGILLPSSGWSWKDVKYSDGTIEESVAGWMLEWI